jgi:hypothetical protein
MQTKFVEKFEQLTAAAKLEAVHSSGGASNGGRIYAQDGFATVLCVTYGFQGDYCRITMTGPSVTALDVHDEPPKWRVDNDREDGTAVVWHALRYTDHARIEEMFDLFEQLLAARPVAASV